MLLPRSTMVVIVVFAVLTLVREAIFWSSSGSSRRFHPGSLAALRVNSSLPVAMSSTFCGDSAASQSFVRLHGINFRWNGPLGPMRALPEPQWAEQRKLMRNPRWWCDKFPVDLSPYTALSQPQRFPVSNDDIVVGVFSGEDVAFTRGVAVRDTWLMRFPRSYIFTEISNSAVPTVGMREAYPGTFKRGTGEVNLWGLKYMIDRNPNSKWFHIIGCDTWVDDDHVREMLSHYDASEDVWLSHGYFLQDVRRQLPNMANLEEVAKNYPNFTGTSIYWYTGAIGYWLSNSVARAYSAELERFQSFFPTQQFSSAPDVDIGALLTFLGFTPTQMDAAHRARMTYSAVDVDHKRVPEAWRRHAKDVTLLHFVHPMRMYSLEQHRLHQKADRLVNAGEWTQLTRFLHEVIDEKAQSQRKNAQAIRYLQKHPLAASFRANLWWDIPENPGEEQEARADPSDALETASRHRRLLLEQMQRSFGPLAGTANTSTSRRASLGTPAAVVRQSSAASTQSAGGDGSVVVIEAQSVQVSSSRCCCLAPRMNMTRCVPSIDSAQCKMNSGVCLADDGLVDHCCCNTAKLKDNHCVYAPREFCAKHGACLSGNATICEQDSTCVKKT